METRRHIQLSQEIAHLAGDFYARNGLVTGVLTTVTRVDLSEDCNQATILLSVLPEGQEEEVLRAAKRSRSDLRDYLKEHGKFHPIPTVDVMIDIGEKNRQRVDELTR